LEGSDCAGRLLFGNEDESRFYRTEIMRGRNILSEEHLEINTTDPPEEA